MSEMLFISDVNHLKGVSEQKQQHQTAVDVIKETKAI
jgi:hypothetical protein